MIVSWNWLKQYVPLEMNSAELERRLMMAGLNHESTSEVGGDLAIDLEVTSNRPDCLGHLGIAREVAVLWGRELKLPASMCAERGPQVATLSSVRLECPTLCTRYTARVIRGVKVGPSPWWLSRRLATVGIATINNVVDVTNYVLMECAQPLHAFDLGKLSERRIVVRAGRPHEKLEAIDHRTYDVGPETCVICDAEKPVAIGGVMGGASSEVTEATRDLLIESAAFDSVSIRNTARRLNLHSASSYRFERPLDPAGVDWASRRACQLILEVAGGELCAGVIDVGHQPPQRAPIVLRYSQLPRVLGIEIPAERVRHILQALGLVEKSALDTQVEVIPPTWRTDLTREIDLIEEVARIHGYEAIPEDVSVPMATSARSSLDRVLERVRIVLTGAGVDEALTLSAVDEAWSSAFSPWTTLDPLCCQTPILRGADRLRRSLVPSLLGARRTNETLSNSPIELFEIAKVYLPSPSGLPTEELMLALTSGGDFLHVKGLLEGLLAALAPGAELGVRDGSWNLLDVERGCELWLADECLGILGEVTPAGLKQFDLREATTIAELRLDVLTRRAVLVPQYAKQPAFPAVVRDLNLVMDEGVRWADLAGTVQACAGPLLESVTFKDIYRDPERLGAGKKSMLFSLILRAPESTLTSQEADLACASVVAGCRERWQAALREG